MMINERFCFSNAVIPLSQSAVLFPYLITNNDLIRKMARMIIRTGDSIRNRTEVFNRNMACIQQRQDPDLIMYGCFVPTANVPVSVGSVKEKP